MWQVNVTNYWEGFSMRDKQVNSSKLRWEIRAVNDRHDLKQNQQLLANFKAIRNMNIDRNIEVAQEMGIFIQATRDSIWGNINK